MTPIWQEYMKAALRPGRRLAPLPRVAFLTTQRLAVARCFDMRAVERLCWDTGVEIGAAAHSLTSEVAVAGDASDAISVDIGEGSVVPAPVTWIEFADAVGVLLDMCGTLGMPAENAGGYALHMIFRYRDAQTMVPEYRMGSAILRNVDGEVEVIDVGGDTSRADRRVFAVKVLAALAVINSRAVERSTIDGHRGLLREISQAGLKGAREITHTKVVLRGPAVSSGRESHAFSAHPRAYHFCRAHARHLSSGQTASVRAHWRGDPAFGVRLPTYEASASRVLH